MWIKGNNPELLKSNIPLLQWHNYPLPFRTTFNNDNLFRPGTDADVNLYKEWEWRNERTPILHLTIKAFSRCQMAYSMLSQYYAAIQYDILNLSIHNNTQLAPMKIFILRQWLSPQYPHNVLPQRQAQKSFTTGIIKLISLHHRSLKGKPKLFLHEITLYTLLQYCLLNTDDGDLHRGALSSSWDKATSKTIWTH